MLSSLEDCVNGSSRGRLRISQASARNDRIDECQSVDLYFMSDHLGIVEFRSSAGLTDH